MPVGIPRKVEPFKDQIEAFRKKLVAEAASSVTQEQVAEVISDNQMLRQFVVDIYSRSGKLLKVTKREYVPNQPDSE